MSRATRRLRGIDTTSVGLAVAAIVAVLGIASVFTALDLSGIVQDRIRALLGLVGVGVGIVLIRRWIDADPHGYRPTERERVRPVGVPGDDLDELLRLRERAGSAEAIRFYRSQLREELRATAVDVLQTHRGYSETEARERLRDGSWTDDDVAASALRLDSGSGVGGEIRNPFSRSGRGEHPATQRARRAIEALTRIAEGER